MSGSIVEDRALYGSLAIFLPALKDSLLCMKNSLTRIVVRSKCWTAKNDKCHTCFFSPIGNVTRLAYAQRAP